jgi:hypothetical protein
VDWINLAISREHGSEPSCSIKGIFLVHSGPAEQEGLSHSIHSLFKNREIWWCGFAGVLYPYVFLHNMYKGISKSFWTGLLE